MHGRRGEHRFSRSTRRRKFQKFLYNKRTGEVCNKRPLNWFTLLLYYLIFFACIYGLYTATIFLINYYVKQSDLPWVDKGSLIKGGSPGLSFAPNIGSSISAIVWYSKDEDDEGDKMPTDYARSIDKFLKAYTDAETKPENYSDCASGRGDKPCMFKKSDLGPCGTADYGYTEDKPCIYLKLNKLKNWLPVQYNASNLPNKMPNFVKEKITGGSAEMIWAFCGGVKPDDQDNVGTIAYFPQQGFPFNFYPYKLEKNYLQPLIAAQFTELKVGRLINVECTIWAKNIAFENPVRNRFIWNFFILG